MGFVLEFTHEALRGLKELENKEAKRIIEKLKKCKESPFSFFERLAGREEYKLRVGGYRVIANILPKERKIIVRTMGHRKRIYKKK